MRRHVTLEIDRVVLREFARAHLGYQPAHIDVPLAVLPKLLPVDLEIVDGAGVGMTRLTSDVDSDRALGALVAVLVDHAGYDQHTLSIDFINAIYAICRTEPSESDVDTLNYATSGSVEAWAYPPSIPERDEDGRNAWDDLFQVVEFSHLIETFTIKYMPMVRLRLYGDDATKVIFSYSEVKTRAPSQARHERRACRMLSRVDVNQIGFGSRDKIELPAPEGAFFETVLLWEARGPARDPYRDLTPSDSSKRFLRRVTPQVAVVQTEGFDVSQYAIVFALRPRRSGLVLQSILATAVLAIILTVGGLFEFFGRKLSPADAPKEAVVVLLLLIPTALLGFLVAGDEHEMLSALLSWPRFLIGLDVLGSITAAMFLVLEFHGLPLASVWVGAGASSTICFLDLMRVWRSSRFAEEAVLNTAGRNSVESVTVFQ